MDYHNKSREELIAEIEILKKKEEGISMILDNINEMFYKISFDDNAKKTITISRDPQGEKSLYLYEDRSLLIISSSHTSNLSLVFRFRSQAWSIRPRGRNISHFLHLHDLLDVRS